MSHRHLESLFREGALGTRTDRELLERFTAHRGDSAEAAFAILVERHAPMVLATCRRLLGDAHDAEDAAQATFLVLARKARTIRSGQAVGGWLHAVAVRIASKARIAAARRRKNEERTIELAVGRPEAPQPTDRWVELHEQIDRLPSRFRLPIVLCYLEGLTHAEAAQQLGWPLGTVESRLARGRERLRERLAGGGVTTMIPLTGASTLLEGTGVSPPAAWVAAAARAACRFAEGHAAVAVASAEVAALTRAMLWSMGWHQARLATAWILTGLVVATGALAALRAQSAAPPPIAQRGAAPIAVAASEKPAVEAPVAPTVIRLGGRVLDPDGLPLPAAKLWLGFQGVDWTWSTRVPDVRATSGPDGRFDVTLADDDPEVKRALRMTSGWPGGFGAIQLVATADGFGPCWTDLAGARGDVELRLVRDDVPVEGRLVSLEGRPLAGIEVRTLLVEDPRNPVSLFGAPSGYFQSATTGADGRFRLAGIGRDRRALLGILGPGIQRDGPQVVTGSFPKDRPPIYRTYPVYPSTFEHPCKPGKTVSGVVRDRETGAPLAGVTVSSVFAVSGRTKTNRDGRYRLEGLSKLSEYKLIASAAESDKPYITTERPIADSQAYEPVTADIAMVRGVVVTGRLIDRANGRPVQAWVGYAALRDNPHWARLPGWIPTVNNRYSPSPGWHAPSMADGSFRIVVPPGSGFLVAHIQYQADRYLPAGVPSKRYPGAPADALDVHYDTVPFELFPSNFPAVRAIDIALGAESASYDLTLHSGVVRTGMVMDPEGRPLTGVSMIGESHQNMNRFHVLEGSQFTVTGLSTHALLPRTLIFRHEARRLGATLRVDVKETGPLQVRLEPTASVTGRLLDASGESCEGIEIQVLRLISEPTRGAQPPFSPPIRATTDADGRFRIEGLVPGTVQKIQAIGFKGASNGFILEDWTPNPGEVKDLGEIRPTDKA
jgi:RNA polymerase sigma factor (sigma-70 family)